jgi:putative ABC transport system permease protein
LTPDVHILTRAEFRAAEIRFWDESTPIGTIFTFGKIIGFVVGMVICYQVIYSDIADHLPEFATLKAMGYPASYFVRLIVVEALLLAVVGFLPGTLVSSLLYNWLSGQTGLLMTMTWDCLTFVLAATVAMCIASGLLALRKLLAADPASLF